jgi:hypothetical protein
VNDLGKRRKPFGKKPKDDLDDLDYTLPFSAKSLSSPHPAAPAAHSNSWKGRPRSSRSFCDVTSHMLKTRAFDLRLPSEIALLPHPPDGDIAVCVAAPTQLLHYRRQPHGGCGRLVSSRDVQQMLH